MRQVIVTGASGFVGRHVVRELIARGIEVTAVARDERKARQLPWFRHVRFIPWDVHADPVSAPTSLFSSHDSFLHLAWTGLPNYNASYHINENLHLTLRFLDAVTRAVPKLLVTGTCFEYGYQSGPLSENFPPAPRNSYAIAKDRLRRRLEALQRERPFTLQWARLFYMYGDGQSRSSLLPQLDAAIARGDPVFNMSPGHQLRDYSPVTAVAAKIVSLAMTDANGIFNVCSGQPVSVRELVERRVAEKCAPIRLNFGSHPSPGDEPLAFWGDDRKLAKLLSSGDAAKRPANE